MPLQVFAVAPYLPLGWELITEPVISDRDSDPPGIISALQHSLEEQIGRPPTDAEYTGQYDQNTARELERWASQRAVYDYDPGIAGMRVYNSLGLIVLRVTCLPGMQFCQGLPDQLAGSEEEPPDINLPPFQPPQTPTQPSRMYRDLLLMGMAGGIAFAAWSLLGRRT